MRAFLLAVLIASQVWPAEPVFEVASIKPNTSPDRNSTWRIAPGGRFTGENVPVVFLVMTAYRLKDFQISGLPGWTESAKYDIDAKGEGNPSEEHLFAMLKGLLAERFKLKYHMTTKEGPVYALVPAKNGIRLHESKEGPCIADDPANPDRRLCGTWFTRGGQIDVKRVTMAQFADALTGQLDRPVIDRTGFSKTFDTHLEWSPTDVSPDAPGDNVGPSIFTAIQEQLGLKLEARKGPVETLVVDYIEKPGEN